MWIWGATGGVSVVCVGCNGCERKRRDSDGSLSVTVGIGADRVLVGTVIKLDGASVFTGGCEFDAKCALECAFGEGVLLATQLKMGFRAQGYCYLWARMFVRVEIIIPVVALLRVDGSSVADAEDVNTRKGVD